MGIHRADTFGGLPGARRRPGVVLHFFFVEDNYVNLNRIELFGGMTDGEPGCRFVVRHNHLLQPPYS